MKTVTLLVGLDKKEEIKPQGTPPAGAPFSGYPAMLEGSGSVARVPAKPVEALLKLVEAPDMLRDRALTRLSAEPDVIEIRNGLGAFELLRPSAGTWQLWKAGAKEPLAADTTAVASMVEAFRKERVSFVEGDPKAREKELDLDKPADRQVSVTFRLAGILADAPKPDEKKDAPAGKPRVREAKPDAVIVFGKRLGEEVAARRSWGDDTALVKAGKGLLDLVEQGSLSYLEKRLPPWRPRPPTWRARRSRSPWPRRTAPWNWPVRPRTSPGLSASRRTARRYPWAPTPPKTLPRPFPAFPCAAGSPSNPPRPSLNRSGLPSLA